MNGDDVPHIKSQTSAHAARCLKVALVIGLAVSGVPFLLPFLLMNMVFSIGAGGSMIWQVLRLHDVPGNDWAILASLMAPCIAIIAGHLAAVAWAFAPANTAGATKLTQAPSRFAACAAATAILFGGWRCIEPMLEPTPLSPFSYPIIASFLLMAWILVSYLFSACRPSGASPASH